jgi:hypothetical protein
MMGDRFGYSTDIGKELEKEQELAKKQEEEKKREQQPPAPAAAETPAAEPAPGHSEEQQSEEPAPVEIEPKRPDPWEDDLNALVSKDIPALRRPATLLQRVESKHVLLLLLTILLFGAWSLQRPFDLAAVESRMEQSAEQQLQAAVAQKIRAEWDLLSAQEKARKAARLYAELRSSPETKAEIARLTAAGKELYEQSPGLPYLFGAESYETLGALQNTPQSGIFAPIARTMSSVAGWRPERALTYAPVLLGMTALVLFFFAARGLTGSSFAGLLAALALAIHPLFYASTAAGHATALSVALVPAMLGVLALTQVFRIAGKPRLVWLAVFAAAMTVLARVWNPWPAILLVLSAHALLYGALAALRSAKSGKRKAWISCAAFTIIAAALAFALVNTGAGGGLLTRLGVSSDAQSFYPAIPEKAQPLGNALLGGHWAGMLVLLLGLGAFIALAIQAFRAEKPLPERVFLLAWTALGIILAAHSPELRMFALLPLLALVAFAAERIARFTQNAAGLFSDNPSPVLARALCCGLIGLVVLGTFLVPARAAARELPAAHDAIAAVARHISQNSAQDAIIVTWPAQTPVHALARRQTLLDEGLAGPRAWWLSKALTTADEREARNILRLMSCGSDREVLGTSQEAYGMRSAHQLLLNLVQSAVDDLHLERPEGVVEINDTLCIPPQGFVVAPESLLAELPALAAIAAFDFRAGYLPEPNPGRVSAVTPCSPGSRVITCSDYRLNLSSLEATSAQNHPAAVYLYGAPGRKSRVFDDAASQYALVVFEDGSARRSFLIEQELAESLLVRIAVNDRTLKYFEPVALARQPERIAAFSVAWHGRNITLQNVVPANATTSELSSLLATNLKD